MSTAHSYEGRFSSSCAFNELESHLENPEDVALLFNSIPKDPKSSDEPASEAILGFGIAKGKKSTMEWRAQEASRKRRAELAEEALPFRKRLLARLRKMYEGLVSRLKH